MRHFLHGRIHDLGGGFEVRRLLPDAACRSVGPFIFFDHFGPVEIAPGERHDVLPHPHIGLATVTYLFSGAILHRDSLGNAQRIEPGAVNWMTAGRGIVHSERTPDEEVGQVRTLHGLQLWLALPGELEACAPGFTHHPAAALPEVHADRARVRVLVGVYGEARSPVAAASETLYLDVTLEAGGGFALPPLVVERALYTVEGTLELDGTEPSGAGMIVLEQGTTHRVVTRTGARFVVIGGAPLATPRFMWWNFVSTRRETIHAAAQAWEAGGFDPVPGDDARVPLPEKRFR